MRVTTFLPVMAGLLLGGCTPLSIQPFFPAQDQVLDTGFPGVWQEKDGDRLLCQKSKDTGYACEVIEKNASSARFQVHLARLGNDLFLDIYPDDPGIAHGLLKAHLLRVHTLGRMRRDGDTLRIAILDTDWVRKKIEAKALNLAHYRNGEKGEDLLLTGSTKSLQVLLQAAAADPKAFTDPDEYRRVH